MTCEPASPTGGAGLFPRFVDGARTGALMHA